MTVTQVEVLYDGCVDFEDRGWRVYENMSSPKKLRDLRCSHVVYKRYTPFSIKLLGTREDFNPACGCSAFQDNNALVSVSPSTRSDINPNPIARLHHFKRHLRKIVSRDEYSFRCLVFVFVQVDQVTARVEYESMVI